MIILAVGAVEGEREPSGRSQCGTFLVAGVSGVGNLLAGDRRRPPSGTSVVAMAAATAVHTVVQYQDALRRASVRVKETKPVDVETIDIETSKSAQPTEL